MGGRQSLVEAGAALGQHDEVTQHDAQLVAAGGAGEVAGQGDDPGHHVETAHDLEGVEQCRRGDRGGALGTQVDRQAGLRQSGHRGLGHDQDGARHRAHRITLRKSHVARALPTTDPDTFDRPAVRGR